MFSREQYKKKSRESKLKNDRVKGGRKMKKKKRRIRNDVSDEKEVWEHVI